MRKTKSIIGYTLVELMVVMALTSILLSIIWLMFVRTSDLLGEVDSLAHTIDKGRFAVERLRTDMQMVGSLGTVDSESDSWVQPKDSTWKVNAVYTYDGWQTRPPPDAVLSPELKAANPNVSFDGIVVMGAYDHPLGFEIGNIPTTLDSGTIVANSRGLHKLHVPDPFRTTQSYPVDFDTADDIAPISAQWGTRVMRIMDASGYMQFVKIADGMDSTDLTTTGSGNNAVEIQFDASDHPPVPKQGGSPFGLDVSVESDRSYEAAVLDVFWYYVRPDPEDAANLQLVRERLCAPAVLTAASLDYTSWNPASTVLPHSDCPGGTKEVVIITDRVVDFQVWFDCAPGYLQPLSSATFEYDWVPPDNAGTCMDPNAENTGLARMMHLRLSLRPATERAELNHYQFENAALDTCDPEDPAGCDLTQFPGERLRTFDVVPGLQGAAPVVTFQTEVMLNNYKYR